ncbi:MAG: succinylglutamate desuccinylase/aspartoacylase family protein [Lachnospiraceae bacterium]|nr:succinylglutamate desuccinylase/aspartoacylase family protein [Lachnospiraceae bacterium]
MVKETLFEIQSLYRDTFRVTGYRFGKGEKAVCIVGSIRGNEVQQLYTCSQVIRRLKELEKAGKLKEGKEILVIPSLNPSSMNIKKRFFPTDNTDINRMFPGYHLGETTQRIAAKAFDIIKEYVYGIQFASFYMPGAFIPHVRMMKTGFEDVEMAKEFGFPYIVLRNPRPYDTTTLNYNWQIWETHAFSIYTSNTEKVDEDSAKLAVKGILNFLDKEGVLTYAGHDGYISQVVDDKDLISVRTKEAGFFECCVKVNEEVHKGQLLARIIDAYEGEVKDCLYAPWDGIVLFMHDEPMTYEDTAVIKLISLRENR